MAAAPAPAAGNGRAARTGKVVVRRRGVMQAKGSRAGEVSQMQRARLLVAAVPVVDELGWSGVTVADIASRARVSRRTFYDLFANREDYLLALLEDTVARVEHELARAGLEDDASWVERVRIGLWTILSFLDRDPVLARVCVVQSARGSRRVLQAREALLARVAGVLDEGRSQNTRAAQTPVLTAEGLVGAAVAIVYKRLLNGERSPLSDLHGELMGLIVLPYVGIARAARERERPAPTPLPMDGTVNGPASRSRSVNEPVREYRDPLRGLPMRLTYRTARVLRATAQNPGASNRQIGESAGITDQGQVSRLLARLQRLGLIANTGQGHARGERNAWTLTPLGERVTEQLSLTTPSQQDSH